MWLIIGLGNPGRKYLYTRHNIGFRVIDRISQELSIPLNRKKFCAKWGKGYWGEKAVILAKPQTFMNLSGEAVAGLQRFYHIDLEHLIIIYDDLDLMFGNIKIREKGSDGGHKGLISIIDHLSGAEFIRVKLGIGRPASQKMVEGYVLESFTEEEMKILPDIILKACGAVSEVILSGTQSAMCKFNVRNN